MVFPHLAEHTGNRTCIYCSSKAGLTDREGHAEEQIPQRKLAMFPEEGRGAGRKDTKCPLRSQESP